MTTANTAFCMEGPFAAIADVKRRKNAAMISLLDESVGRILKTLRDSTDLIKTHDLTNPMLRDIAEYLQTLE